MSILFIFHVSSSSSSISNLLIDNYQIPVAVVVVVIVVDVVPVEVVFYLLLIFTFVVTDRFHRNLLVGFFGNGISTFVGYLMPKLSL